MTAIQTSTPQNNILKPIELENGKYKHFKLPTKTAEHHLLNKVSTFDSHWTTHDKAMELYKAIESNNEEAFFKLCQENVYTANEINRDFRDGS